MSITILDVARARGVEEIDGKISGGEFQRVGLSILGGCGNCHATLGAYNAYPTTTGFWGCRECTEGAEITFATTEEFEAWSKEQDAREEARIQAEEDLSRMYALENDFDDE